MKRNVKLYAGRRPSSSTTHEPGTDAGTEPTWKEEERNETAQCIRIKQAHMEEQVFQIWTCVFSSVSFRVNGSLTLTCYSANSILSAFEESSAACISDMLKHVSDGQFLDAIRDAEKFILHVEVLFAAIDDLEYCFFFLNLKGKCPQMQPCHRS